MEGNILKLRLNVMWMQDGGEGKCSEGTEASICLQRRECQVLLILSEWLPADVDLILYKCRLLSCVSAHQTVLYTHTFTCSMGYGGLEVQNTTTVNRRQ